MKQKIFQIFADLRFSISILLVISSFSLIGTIIEQDQSIEVYKKNYPLITPMFGFLSWDIILKFNLDHIYTTWWFYSLIFLFGLSLILCSFLQQLPALRVARRCQFFRTKNQFYRLKISTTLNNFSLSKISSRLKTKSYSIFQQKNIIYCYKGLMGQMAPIIVHFSMILVLLGTIVTSLTGFKAQEIVPKTESFHVQNLLTKGTLTIIPKTSIRINDFWITYAKRKTISQFYADISILNNFGNEALRKTIHVNYPLIYKNIYYYQTDWNLLGLRFQNFKDQVIEYPLINILKNKEKLWLTWISNNQELTTGIVIIIDNLEGYCSVYNDTGEFIGNLELNEQIKTKQNFYLMEIISSTGLQIKIDPGIVIIYLGFFFLIISTLVSYITYSQIWLVKKKQTIFIGGNTNRAIFDFELDFLKFVREK